MFKSEYNHQNKLSPTLLPVTPLIKSITHDSHDVRLLFLIDSPESEAAAVIFIRRWQLFAIKKLILTKCKCFESDALIADRWKDSGPCVQTPSARASFAVAPIEFSPASSRGRRTFTVFDQMFNARPALRGTTCELYNRKRMWCYGPAPSDIPLPFALLSFIHAFVDEP